MAYTIITDSIRKSYGGRVVLDDVDLALESGSVLALLGPNGAGKTTIVRILATLVRPDAGTATIAGHDLLADPVGVQRSISLTGQYAAVDEILTGQENLEMMGRLRHLSRRAARVRADALLAEFDLREARDRRVKTYSGGMKRRLDLAISMITRPELVFLDEPTTGLDPRSRESLWGTVRRLVDEGVSVLLTTQHLEEADQLADTIAVLDHGRIVARGTPDRLKASLGREFVRLQFAERGSYEAALGRLAPARADARLRTIDVATGGTADEVLQMLGRLQDAGTPALKVSSYRPTLEDVFRSVTSSDPTHTRTEEMAR
jgi:ABC-2 type transport system ATP-binding protein